MRWTVIGLALALLDIGAVLFGFGIYSLVRPANQLAVQVPAAVIAVVAGWWFWTWAPGKLGWNGLRPAGPGEALQVYLLALAWGPAVFIPLHYVTQGYVTSFGNLAGLWLFQVPSNVLALWAVGRAGG